MIRYYLEFSLAQMLKIDISFKLVIQCMPKGRLYDRNLHITVIQEKQLYR